MSETHPYSLKVRSSIAIMCVLFCRTHFHVDSWHYHVNYDHPTEVGEFKFGIEFNFENEDDWLMAALNFA